MRSNVICGICGHHKQVEGKLNAVHYFPNKLVYKENGAYISCEKCYDNYFIIENQDYIDLLGKTSITGNNKEFIRKSNEIYIAKVLDENNLSYSKEICKEFPKQSQLNQYERTKNYWLSAKIINSKI